VGWEGAEAGKAEVEEEAAGEIMEAKVVVKKCWLVAPK